MTSEERDILLDAVSELDLFESYIKREKAARIAVGRTDPLSSDLISLLSRTAGSQADKARGEIWEQYRREQE